MFSHWEQLNGDPYEAGSKGEAIVNQIRARKGLKAGIPSLDNFIDKM